MRGALCRGRPRPAGVGPSAAVAGGRSPSLRPSCRGCAVSAMAAGHAPRTPRLPRPLPSLGGNISGKGVRREVQRCHLIARGRGEGRAPRARPLPVGAGVSRSSWRCGWRWFAVGALALPACSRRAGAALAGAAVRQHRPPCAGPEFCTPVWILCRSEVQRVLQLPFSAAASVSTTLRDSLRLLMVALNLFRFGFVMVTVGLVLFFVLFFLSSLTISI